MQGKLSEIDIRSILQLIELGQRTGELFIEAYPSHPQSSGIDGAFTQAADLRPSPSLSGQSWFVFFLNGQMIYAADSGTSLARLRDYLHRYEPAEDSLDRLTVPSSIVATNAPEYGYLWALLEKHTLTPAQGRSIIQGMINETLFDLFSLHQGAFIFEQGSPLSPQLSTLEITPLLARTMKQAQLWKQLQPYIYSPEQYPMVANVEALREQLSHRTFNKLCGFADGKTSIRQISRYLNRDILTVGKAIYPYVQQGVIQFNPSVTQEPTVRLAAKLPRNTEFSTRKQGKPPKVVCVDDGMTVRETVKAILGSHGYEVTAIANPLDSFSLVFQLKPDIILCDIAMPELDGYEVCAMLRTSTAFRQTPIVMLTGKDGFIDRVKARMVGATDYLTKPFGESELLMLVEKYVGSGYSERHQDGKALGGELEDGRERERTDTTSTSSTPLN